MGQEILFGQAVNTWFNILLSFMSEKKKVEMMLEKNAEAFNDNAKMLFGSKFE